jgi:hypothetical protein
MKSFFCSILKQLFESLRYQDKILVFGHGFLSTVRPTVPSDATRWGAAPRLFVERLIHRASLLSTSKVRMTTGKSTLTGRSHKQQILVDCSWFGISDCKFLSAPTLTNLQKEDLSERCLSLSEVSDEVEFPRSLFALLIESQAPTLLLGYL